MSLLEDARRLADPGIGTSCDFCTGSETSGHFNGCPILAAPRIVAALEAADDLIEVATTGPQPVGGEGPMPFNAWRRFVRALRGEDS